MDRRPSHVRVETFAAVGLGLGGVAEVVVPLRPHETYASPAVCATVILATCALFLVVRRWPTLPLVGALAAWMLLAFMAPDAGLNYGQFLLVQLAMALAIRSGRRHEPGVVIALVSLGLLVVHLTRPELHHGALLMFHGSVIALFAGAGLAWRHADQRAADARRGEADARVAAKEAAMQAVLAERTRIAREMHDIVAHAVTSMVVQAGAASEASDDREFVELALNHIRETGHEALTEMRQAVDLLRGADTPPGARRGSDALEALVSSTRASGLETHLALVGDVHDLPPGIGQAVYRVVQEALTNVRRHSDARSCWVTVDCRDGIVTATVHDDGTSASAPAAGGHGLLGMRERVSLHGGRFDAGPRAEGGFGVRASFPLADASTGVP